MNKGLLLISSVVVCLLVSGMNAQKDRKPAVSGKFYPSNKNELIKVLDKYLDVNISNKSKNKKLGGLIVPHAGYFYSGKTAGYGFSLLKNKSYGTVVIMGSSHYAYLERPTTTDLDSWITPLGKVSVDKKLIGILEKNKAVVVNNDIFTPEHSLEVELPFLQRTLSGDFKILPILVNEFNIKELSAYAKIIAKTLKGRKNIIFVMSTDMSHYFSAEIAQNMDKKVNKALLANNLDELQRLCLLKEGQLCGIGGVVLGLMVLKELGMDGVEQLHYSHSGMASGDNKKVVGYGAYAVYKNAGGKEKKMTLNKDQRNKLIQIARNTIRNIVSKNKKYKVNDDDPLLNEKRGVFVTIHKKGSLRGCIGNIMPLNKLYLAVRDMAIQSSMHDPRFPAVTEDELDEIDIEISVLTVPELTRHEDVVMGRDGVIVKQGFRQGVYLPQVADETGWGKEKFLSSLCYSKAGLDPDAWKDEKTELFTFQAEVFGEKEMGIK